MQPLSPLYGDVLAAMGDALTLTLSPEGEGTVGLPLGRGLLYRYPWVSQKRRAAGWRGIAMGASAVSETMAFRSIGPSPYQGMLALRASTAAQNWVTIS